MAGTVNQVNMPGCANDLCCARPVQVTERREPGGPPLGEVMGRRLVLPPTTLKPQILAACICVQRDSAKEKWPDPVWRGATRSSPPAGDAEACASLCASTFGQRCVLAP